MRSNATIRFLMPAADAGFDDDGIPMAKAEEWTDPVPCLAAKSSDDRRGRYADGVFRKVSFSALVEAGRFTAAMGEAAMAELHPDGEPRPVRQPIVSITRRPSFGTVQIDL